MAVNSTPNAREAMVGPVCFGYARSALSSCSSHLRTASSVGCGVPHWSIGQVPGSAAAARAGAVVVTVVTVRVATTMAVTASTAVASLYFISSSLSGSVGAVRWAQRAGRGSADFAAVDHDVAEVVMRGVVERATTGDQSQLGIGCWAEHHRRGEVRLGVLMHPGNLEDGEPAVRLPDVDPVAWVQIAEAVEDPRAEVGIDVPGDDRGPDLARPRAAGIPAGHRGAAWHLQRALPGETQPDQPGAHPDGRDPQRHRQR